MLLVQPFPRHCEKVLKGEKIVHTRAASIQRQYVCLLEPKLNQQTTLSSLLETPIKSAIIQNKILGLKTDTDT